ncbi:N-6 DNA methylase [Bradyrhizobium sp. NBAIM20]|uniref:Eco57I restriction-modification methylase domain-containing protein n=1 Tax=unclassified Bradyrhizobium TaxID=2631580 RepID=UPI001CD36A4C|nr:MULTISPECIES: N-6 DNA methylase [unclassified Bradyrhizobium]MCA1412672.1 N-6 DNA methylase [Bradyrhizobium sp. NBAIM20]MCA1463478.1 N-6 DNA methylase [Bradyrhizobium sp. NBAIM18]
MDLIGIENEAEFFPAGALSDSLQDELREITSRWSKAVDGENPVDRLAGCCEPYLVALRKIRNAADAANGTEWRQKITYALVTALGYEYERKSLHTALQGETLIPALATVADVEGRDVAWLIEAPLVSVDDESTDPLSLNFRAEQFPYDEREFAETERAIEEILGDGIFELRCPPRLVIVFGLSQIVLVDRHKWPARSVLRFDLQEIFSRQDKDTLATMACLLSREARVPHQGVPIADRIEEEAQRNANTVTTSLKRTVRDAIEILGQEVLDVTEGKYPAGPRKGVWIDGPELSLECLRYMYRLLFLFYAEANPRLNVLNLKDPVYASGYSIEALRELESVRLRTPAEKNGTYLWESLQRTLGLLYSGSGGAMRLPAVKVSLLDPESTPILNSIRLRNEAVQKVIRLLSLKQSSNGTARISYAKLGIGQLGAVYETLISFTGVVAKQDLIELRPPKGRGSLDAEEDEESSNASHDEEDENGEEEREAETVSRQDDVDFLAPSYFVPRSRAAEFKPEQLVFNGPEARVYPKGSFIYRLAGRDREKSASYYTPEALARLLVKHALQERCKDLAADEILELKILEPAMGSAAFLVEATNQLADIYLERKQKETGKTVPQDQVAVEKQKVRAFISDRNCFGVDLNPVATELGAISLWLNGLHASEFSPWFRDQLHAGNSLVGARRASYAPLLMSAKKKDDLWYSHKPQEIGWRGGLPEDHIWQFLLPAEDMARFDSDKSIAGFAADAQKKIKAWRKDGFFTRLEPHEIKLLQKLSRIAENLFNIVADDLAKSRASTNDAITIWPDKEMLGVRGLDFHEKDRHLQKLIGADRASNTLPYKRLKTAMDAWCALWLWPLDKAHLLPSRQEFLHGMTLILEGGFLPDGSIAVPSIEEYSAPERDLFDQITANENAGSQPAPKKKQAALFHETNVDALIQEVEWLSVACEVAQRERFTHYDLIFADVLRERGGFDVIVGNPPWAKPVWNEADMLGDIDPGFVVRGLSAFDTRKALPGLLSKGADRKAFLDAYATTKGAMTATGSAVMNPFAGGGHNNLYRCFVDLSFRLVSETGSIGLIHEDGHLAETKGGEFRKHWYSRISKHFNFSNQIVAKNFSEVLHTKFFSLNVYRGASAPVAFEQFTNAFLASQVEDSYRHDGAGEVPGIKWNGSWDTRGHKKRILHIDNEFLNLSTKQGDADKSHDPVFYQFLSADIQDAFLLFSSLPTLRESGVIFESDGLLHESGAQDAGTIIKRTDWVGDDRTIILSSPVIFCGNPLAKTPRRVCRVPQDYDPIDLHLIDDAYRPRANYQLAKSETDVRRLLPKCEWDKTASHIDTYRMAYRRRVDLGTERSLSTAIIPPKTAHINSLESMGFSKQCDLLTFSALTSAIPLDFLIKGLRQGNIYASVIANLPFVDPGDTARHRALRLACLTNAYADLWNEQAPALTPNHWHSADPRLAIDGPLKGPATWDRTAALRTDFARRMALVEIDVLVAQALGLKLDQLIDIYRIYFPVLQQNEAGTWYDRNGRIVWTCSKGLPGIGFLEDGRSPSGRRWEEILTSGKTYLECEAVVDYMPGGPHKVVRTYEGPFDTCDRVEDYKRAWTYFEKHQEREAA